jgi:hypothetical protein
MNTCPDDLSNLVPCFPSPGYWRHGGAVTREEFSKLNDEEAKAYLLAELKTIASAEAFANKGLEAAVGNIVLTNFAEQMLKRFQK